MGAALDDTVDALGEVVAECRGRSSRAGYFAAMYAGVTREVRRQLSEGVFVDPERMELFVATFAGRYLDAYRAWRAGAPVAPAWQVAFEAAESWRPLIVQHLLLGMNAHINVDLGVVAAEVAPGDDLRGLRNDFDTVNDILGSLAGREQDAVGELSPWLGLLDRVGGRTDEAVLGFSIRRARAGAWETASTLAPLAPSARASPVRELDERVARLGRKVLSPGFGLRSATFVVRLRETTSVEDVTDALDRVVAR